MVTYITMLDVQNYISAFSIVFWFICDYILHNRLFDKFYDLKLTVLIDTVNITSYVKGIKKLHGIVINQKKVMEKKQPLYYHSGGMPLLKILKYQSEVMFYE